MLFFINRCLYFEYQMLLIWCLGWYTSGYINCIFLFFIILFVVMISLNKDNINTKVHFLKWDIDNEKEKYKANYCKVISRLSVLCAFSIDPHFTYFFMSIMFMLRPGKSQVTTVGILPNKHSQLARYCLIWGIHPVYSLTTVGQVTV